MTTLTHSEAITGYAAQVRAALAGIDEDIVDDLTDGLEADLSEAILDDLELDGEASPTAALASLDADALVARFGAPVDYASELAAAADVTIPQPTTAKRRPIRESLAATRATVGEQWAGLKARHAWLNELADGMRSLRPVWWVARALGLFAVASGFAGTGVYPRDLVGWILALVLIALSVQAGRGRLRPRRWGRGLVIVWNWVAVLGLYLMLLNSGASGPAAAAWDEGYAEGLANAPQGVVIDGVPARNLFVYDAAGQPVESARIVDQDGRPVILSPEWGGDMTWLDVSPGVAVDFGSSPAFVFDGAISPNAYPYTWVDGSDVDQLPGGPGVDGEYAYELDTRGLPQPDWPAATLTPLPGASSEPENPVATSDLGAEPSAEPTAEPSPEE